MYKTAEPEYFASRIQESVAKGFTAVKAMPVPVSELIESADVLRHSARCVEAMRKAVGDKIDIMLDLHARTTTAAAIQFGRMLVEYNPYWYEEPCWPEHVEDRKSTRLNSSHTVISYAVFCLKKKITK